MVPGKNIHKRNRFLRGVSLATILLFLASLLLFSASTGRATADSPQTQPVSERFGAHDAHIGKNSVAEIDAALAKMKAAGIRWLRMNFPWLHLDEAEGSADGWKFETDSNHYDYVVRKANSLGIKILGIITGPAPGWANSGWSYPYGRETEWKRYVKAVARHYNGVQDGADPNPQEAPYFPAEGADIGPLYVDAFEIWNEENIYGYWLIVPDPVAYTDLLKITYPVIKGAHPNATVVMGGVNGLGFMHYWGSATDNWKFFTATQAQDGFDGCFRLGALQYVDAVAYHPYPGLYDRDPNQGPDDPMEVESRNHANYLKDLTRKPEFNPSGKEIGIWNTEFGWEYTDPNQASYLLRSMINYAGNIINYPDGTKRPLNMAIWYTLWENPNEGDGKYCGLWGNILDNNAAKNSYYYYKTFQAVVGPTSPIAKPGFITVTTSNSTYLEQHYFQHPDGSIAMAFWQRDAQQRSLNISITQPGFEQPRKWNLLSCTSSPIGSGNTNSWSITGLATNGTPVIITLNVPKGTLSVSSITPNSAAPGNFVAISNLAGTGFEAWAKVRLEGPSTIEACNANTVSSNKITCYFDLTGAPEGTYNVVVENPNGQKATLSGGFTVSSQCGTGSGSAVLLLGLTLGLLSLAGGYGRRRRKARDAA